jgi:acyl-CoA reductase-like NAD-dependent aldehyde dehydrogenase
VLNVVSGGAELRQWMTAHPMPRKIEFTGSVATGAWVNTHLALQPNQPSGGAKWSGIGVENGPWGYYGFTELQVLYRAKS